MDLYSVSASLINKIGVGNEMRSSEHLVQSGLVKVKESFYIKGKRLLPGALVVVGFTALLAHRLLRLNQACTLKKTHKPDQMLPLILSN